MTQFEKLDLLLRECGGTIQTFQVLNNGISKSVFYAYVKERGLEQAYIQNYINPPERWRFVSNQTDIGNHGRSRLSGCSCKHGNKSCMENNSKSKFYGMHLWQLQENVEHWSR